jgi:hypothetical protein
MEKEEKKNMCRRKEERCTKKETDRSKEREEEGGMDSGGYNVQAWGTKEMRKEADKKETDGEERKKNMKIIRIRSGIKEADR